MGFYFEFPKKERKSKAKYDCDKCKRGGICSPNYVNDHIGADYDGLVIVRDFPISNHTMDGLDIVKTISIKHKVKSKDIAVLNMVKCFNRKEPTQTQYKCCLPNIEKQLKELKPKLIIACGDASFQYLMGLPTKISVSRARNHVIPNYNYNCLLYPTFNFSPYTVHDWRYDKGLQYHIQDTLRSDLHYIFNQWNESIHKRRIVDKFLKERRILDNTEITEIKDFNQLKEMFKQVFSLPQTSFDYETTNTYPYDEHFEIVYIGFGYENKAWVLHEDLWKDKPIVFSYIKRNIRKYLTSTSQQKFIQNAKFEDLCSRYIFGTVEINNVFDSMIATHVINEKKQTKSQDFQNLVRFGIPPYNETIKSFLETDEKDEEQKQNNIRAAKKSDMILYNGLDCITCYYNCLLLRDKYLPRAYPKAKENYDFLMRGARLFANLTQRGVYIGQDEFNEFSNIIEDNLGKIMLDVLSMPEVKQYNNYLKENMGAAINLEENLLSLMKKNKKQRSRRRLILK